MERVQVLEPHTTREARVAHYLNRGEDFYPLRRWPLYLQVIALSEHRTNRERFTLFSFLTGNGLSPTVAQEWILMTDVSPTRGITSYGYDDQAHRQASQMVRQVMEGTFFKGDKRMMDMSLGRTVFQ